MMEESGEFDYVPYPTTVSIEKNRIKSEGAYRDRMGQMNRATEEWADQPTTYHDATVPTYLADELERMTGEVNAKRYEDMRRAYPNWYDMSEAEKAEKKTYGNFEHIADDMYTPDDLEDLIDETMSTDEAAYVENYIAAWVEWCVIPAYKQQVVNDIRYIASAAPGFMTKILHSGDERATIEYIYPPGHGAYMGDVVQRHYNIVDFWEARREEVGEYLNNPGENWEDYE